MNEKFPDAGDEDDDILMTRMFLGEQAADKGELEKFAEPFAKIENETDLLEIPELKVGSPPLFEAEEFAAEPLNLDALVETPTGEFVDQAAPAAAVADFQTSAENTGEKAKNDTDFLAANSYQPETSDETVRKSGLAYSAAIILFGSIVFTLILGWFADLLFGTSPWGKVGGIILGAIIGFIQFFRTTSQILKNKD